MKKKVVNVALNLQRLHHTPLVGKGGSPVWGLWRTRHKSARPYLIWLLVESHKYTIGWQSSLSSGPSLVERSYIEQSAKEAIRKEVTWLSLLNPPITVTSTTGALNFHVTKLATLETEIHSLVVWDLDLDDQGVGKMASSGGSSDLQRGASSCPHTAFPHCRCKLPMSHLQV